jgi:hypothetical protein
LDERVIELSVGIYELFSVDKELKSLSQTFFGSMVLGKRTHDLRMVNKEGRGVTLDLKVLSDEFVEKSGSGPGSRARNFQFFTKFVQEKSGLFAFEIFGHFFAENFFDLFNYRNSSPGSFKGDLFFHTVLSLDIELKGTLNLQDDLGQQLFSEVHHVMVVCIGIVELDRGKLRVMGQVDLLISELLAYLIDLVESTDDTVLKV